MIFKTKFLPFVPLVVKKINHEEHKVCTESTKDFFNNQTDN
jgi:hypothetical protein